MGTIVCIELDNITYLQLSPQQTAIMNLPSSSLSDDDSDHGLHLQFELHTDHQGFTTVMQLGFRVQPAPGSIPPPSFHPHPTQVSPQGHMQCGAWAFDHTHLSIPSERSWRCLDVVNQPSEHCTCYYMYHSPFCTHIRHCCSQSLDTDVNYPTSCTCMRTHQCMCPCIHHEACHRQETGPSKPAELVLTGQTGSLTRYLPRSLRRNRSEEKVQPIQETNPDSPSELVLGPAAIFGSRYQILVHAPSNATINRSLRMKEDAKMKALRVVIKE